MTPAAAVTDGLLHDLVTFSRAEGTAQLAVAAVILDDRILLCGQTTQDFDQEWDLPSGLALPGETLTSALDRILACGYGLDTVEIPRYLGSHDHIPDGETTRTFVFTTTTTCADPQQICQHAQIPDCWADLPASPARSARSASTSPASPTSPRTHALQHSPHRGQASGS